MTRGTGWLEEIRKRDIKVQSLYDNSNSSWAYFRILKNYFLLVKFDSSNQRDGRGLTRVLTHVSLAWWSSMTEFCVHWVLLEHLQQQLDLPDAQSWASPDQGKRYGPSGQAAWTVHHNTNLTRQGYSTPASQAGLRVGSSIYPSASLVQTLAIFVLVVTLCCLLCIFPRLSETNSGNRILIYSNENKNASLQSFFQCPWRKKENSKCNFLLKYC